MRWTLSLVPLPGTSILLKVNPLKKFAFLANAMHTHNFRIFLRFFKDSTNFLDTL